MYNDNLQELLRMWYENDRFEIQNILVNLYFIICF